MKLCRSLLVPGIFKLKPLAIAVFAMATTSGYTADEVDEPVNQLTPQASSHQVTEETVKLVDDTRLLARAQERIDADSREIDAMSLRIKEMIRARHLIETQNLKNQRIIEHLKRQLAELNTQRDEAQLKHQGLLSEKDDLLRQLDALRKKNQNDRESIASLNGVATRQEGIIASLENDLNNARSDLQTKQASIADLQNRLDSIKSDEQQAQQKIDSLNAKLANANQTGSGLTSERDRLAGELDRLQAHATQSLADERDAHAITRNQLANTENKLAGIQQRLAELQTAHTEATTEKTALQATADGLGTQLQHMQSELDNRVTEIQAATSDFVNLKDKINGKEADLIQAKGQIADANQEIDALQKQVAMLTGDRNKYLDTNGSLQSTIDELQSRLAAKAADYKQLNSRYNDEQTQQTGIIANLNNDINALNEQMARSNADQSALQTQYEKSLKDINKLNAKLAKNGEEHDALSSQKQQLATDLAGLKKQNSALQDELAELAAKNNAVLQEKIALKGNQRALGRTNETLLTERDSQAQQLQTLTGIRDALAAERDELSVERDSLAENLSSVQKERDSLQAAIDALTAEKEKLSARTAALVTERDNLSAQFQTATDKSNKLLANNNGLTVSNRDQAETINALKNKLAEMQANADSTNAEFASFQQNSADQISQLQQALAASQQQLEASNGRLNALMQENEQIDSERNRLADNAEALRQKLEDELAAAELNFVTVQKAREDSSIPLRLGSADFFATGSAELTAEGRANLQKLTDIITKFDDRRIVVAGHTDSRKIGQRLKSRYFSNWELSVARAAAAVRFMQHKSNIDPTNISAAGYSEYLPIADNATPEGRQMNRRVEVVLYPRVEKEKLYSELDE